MLVYILILLYTVKRNLFQKSWRNSVFDYVNILQAGYYCS